MMKTLTILLTLLAANLTSFIFSQEQQFLDSYTFPDNILAGTTIKVGDTLVISGIYDECFYMLKESTYSNRVYLGSDVYAGEKISITKIYLSKLWFGVSRINSDKDAQLLYVEVERRGKAKLHINFLDAINSREIALPFFIGKEYTKLWINSLGLQKDRDFLLFNKYNPQFADENADDYIKQYTNYYKENDTLKISQNQSLNEFERRRQIELAKSKYIEEVDNFHKKVNAVDTTKLYYEVFTAELGEYDFDKKGFLITPTRKDIAPLFFSINEKKAEEYLNQRKIIFGKTRTIYTMIIYYKPIGTDNDNSSKKIKWKSIKIQYVEDILTGEKQYNQVLAEWDI